MSNLFDTMVSIRRKTTPWARVNPFIFMTEMATNVGEGNSEAILTVQPRPSVASRRWWTISWVGQDGKRHEESAQELALCLWRAAEREIQIEEEIDRKEKEEEGKVTGEGTIESAGVRWHAVGKNGRFRHRVQVPWIFLFKNPQDAKAISRRLEGKKFTVIERIELDGLTTSHIVENQTGENFDLVFDEKGVCVYPTSNQHQEASERLRKFFETIDAQGG